MNRIAAAISCLFLCAAAPAPATPPPKTYTVTLTPIQMQAIARALILTSKECDTSDEACQIGLQKTGIIQAFNTALTAGQEKKP